MEEGILFYMAISGAKRLFLTFPGIDDEGKDSSMSPYLREIQKVVHSSFHTGVTGSAWEGGYVTGRGRSENVIRILRDGSDSDSMISSLKSCDSELYEEIKRALDAYIKFEKNQNMNLSTEDSKEILAERWGKKHIFSVTDFEMYNSCPIKFFLTRILGLQLKFPAVDGLDHSERGIIIHEILAQFYKTLFLRKDKTSFTRNEFEYCTVLMQEIVDSIFHTHAGTDRLKKQHPVVFSSEKRYIQRWMNYFLELEADYFENSPFYPHLFEINFGNGSYPPLELEHAGKKIMVKGRIDRIDIAEEDGRPYSRVIDYKTGRALTGKVSERIAKYAPPLGYYGLSLLAQRRLQGPLVTPLRVHHVGDYAYHAS